MNAETSALWSVQVTQGGPAKRRRFGGGATRMATRRSEAAADRRTGEAHDFAWRLERVVTRAA